MHWENVAGHSGAIKILKNMLAADRVPHALLFAGQNGLGKMLVANIFAAGLLCSDETEEKPCGDCFSCRKAKQGGHPDLMVLHNDGGSLKIDQIRALQHEAALVPYHGGRRVFIIENAERLTTQAANSILKILEEPPEATVFVLTSSSTYALLPTIVSRCWLVPFYPLAAPELAEFLAAKGFDKLKSSTAASLSGGRIGEALTLLEPDGLEFRNQALAKVFELPKIDAAAIEESAVFMDKLEANQRQTLLRYINYILRDLLVILVGQEDLLFNKDIALKLREISSVWDQASLRQAWQYVRQAAAALETNANPRLVCEALFINLSGAVKEGK